MVPDTGEDLLDGQVGALDEVPEPIHASPDVGQLFLGCLDGSWGQRGTPIDPILGNSALDRLANASYQIVIEGHSYRARLSPHRALSEPKGMFDPLTAT